VIPHTGEKRRNGAVHLDLTYNESPDSWPTEILVPAARYLGRRWCPRAAQDGHRVTVLDSFAVQAAQPEHVDTTRMSGSEGRHPGRIDVALVEASPTSDSAGRTGRRAMCRPTRSARRTSTRRDPDDAHCCRASERVLRPNNQTAPTAAATTATSD